MKSKRIYLISAILVIAAVMLAACGQAAATPAADQAQEAPAAEEEMAPEEAAEAPAEEAAGVTIEDSAGNVVELPSLPQRVVVAGKATPYTLSTTYVFEEASDRVVALELRGLTIPEFLSLIDPKYDEKVKLEMDAGAEQIAPVNPDIVITKNYVVKSLKESLDPLGIPVVGLNMETPDVFYKDIDMLGQLFGNPERAAEVNAYLQDKVAAVQTAMEGLTEEEKPSVLVLQYSEQDGEVAFKVPPVSYIQTTMVTDGGGIPVWADEATAGESNWIVVNFEQIAAWDPDVILVIDYKGNPQETAASLKTSDLWSELSAVKSDRVYGFGKDFQGWDLPDPRWILGYTWTATKLQPERMAGVDMTAMVKEFYGFMYRLSDEQIETSIMPMVYAD
ncbi:MAG: iron complex transport system substrate-binding protein [Chloroflexota bacterium]|nr:iron complex transport system substrate-binding protein [Chloroflexota bacterium]